ncbi:PREDICTED: probable respiratory burst oxidase homolog protein I [Camelina sativa]|uniref:Probable respiratory burst oxidase homolog protein I n=1 Tax=Camelina sativa TaxID=90675 RepID=A0ABM0VFU7_CAMSA|nr:PREDICTED: probable respiratory burst oxidase homolog protein I [Camelina sativa]
MSMSFSGGTHDDDRWGSNLASAGEFTQSSQSLPAPYSPFSSSSSSGEELVEVTIEFPSGVLLNIDSVTTTDQEMITSCSASNSGTMSRSLGWSASSSHRNSELHTVERAKKFSRDLKQKLQRISLGYSSRSAPEPVVPNVTDHAILCRTLTQRFTNRIGTSTQRAIHGLKFISSKDNGIADWRQVQNNFVNLSKDGHISRSDFAICIGMENENEDSKEFGEELFDALCRRRRLMVDKINLQELYEFWYQITDDSFDSRLQIFFNMVKNGDGRITEKEVKEIIILSASANNLSRLRQRAEEYAALIMEELAPDGLDSQYIELKDLEMLLLEKDISHSYSQPYSQTSRALSQNLKDKRWGIIRSLLYSLQDNWKRIWVLTLWLVIMAWFFMWKCVQYKNKDAFHVMGYCLVVAKGAAETLKFNMALILLPVCRNTITYLRSTGLSYAVPFDESINFHKTISLAIIVAMVIHSSSHLACDFPRILTSTEADYKRYLVHYFGVIRPTYFDLVNTPVGITGFIMVAFMVIAFTLASRRCRRNLTKLPKPFDKLTGYNAFWYSHHLLLMVYVLLVIHGFSLYLEHKWYRKTIWMYLSVPVLLYAGERILRFFRSRLYTVEICKVVIYPGNVIVLRMSKPTSFDYKSGQYIYVQCPAVSKFEWHPFSITSSPGDDYLSIHIRQLGDWTEGIKKAFSVVCQAPEPGKSGLLRADGPNQRSLPELLIDGPYGAPAQDHWKYDVVLLVGLGIGATPFISILRDLLNNIIKQNEQAVISMSGSRSNSNISSDHSSSCLNSEARIRSPQNQTRTLMTKNAYFYWVTREQGSFDWFKEIMNEIADLDIKGVIEMHNYLTSVYEEGDTRSTLLTMIQTLNHAKNGVDIFSGTKVRTHFGRPKWKKVLSKISTKHRNARIGVFYCGVPSLGKELSTLCHEFNQTGCSRFEFHKEQF